MDNGFKDEKKIREQAGKCVVCYINKIKPGGIAIVRLASELYRLAAGFCVTFGKLYHEVNVCCHFAQNVTLILHLLTVS